MIVLQGLKGKPIADKARREFALERENARLKHMIGELTMELKKSEFGLL